MTFLLDHPWLAAVIPLAVMVALALIMRPKIWIACLMACLPILLTSSGKGLSIIELAMGGFFAASVIFWFIWKLATGGKPLVRNWFDVLVLTFCLVSTLNIVLAVSNGITALEWFSEWVLFTFMLYYFPLREYFGENDKDFSQLLMWFAITTIVLSLQSVYNYKTRLEDGMAYAWQLTASRSVLLGPVFFVAILVCLSWYFTLTRRKRLFVMAVIGFNSIALFLTFTRTLWVMIFVSVGMMMLFFTWKQNLRIVAGFLTVVVVVVSGAYAVNPRFAALGVKIITKRFASSTQLKGGDHSFDTRVVEAGYAWQKIKENPFGNGLRVPIVVKVPESVTTRKVSFIHFGYVSLLYKVGFPLALLFFFALGLQFWMALKNLWRLRSKASNPVLRSTAIAIAAYFPALFFIIFFTGFFDTRYGNVIFAFVFACTGIIYDRLNK